MFLLAELSPYQGDSIPLAAVLGGGQPCKTFDLGYGTQGGVSSQVLELATSGSGLRSLTVANVERIELVRYGAQVFTVAVDSSDIQPGEFSFNSLTGQLQINGTFIQGHSLALQAADPDAVLLEYAITSNAGLPDIFQRYELIGAVGWGCDWEGHPKGQFELLTNWATADLLEQELIPKKTSLEMFGIGFEVDGFTITKRSPLECPQLEARVSVSLRGKWERYLEDPVMLLVDNGATSTGARTIRGDTTVEAIAQKVGAKALIPPNRIESPKQATDEVQVTLQEVFEGNLRHNRCFGSYSSADQIAAVRLDSVPVHNVAYADLYNTELQIQVKAYPRALDYKNGRLEWGDRVPAQSTYGEDTQGKAKEALPPQWRLKPPRLEVFPSGSANLNPPSDIATAMDSSLCFDNGGPTREQTWTWTENGAVVRQTYVKCGFQAVAADHLYTYAYADEKPHWDNINANPAQFWTVVEQWEAEYVYASDTGYLRDIRITAGWRSLRFQAEGNNESLDAWVSWYKESDSNKKQKKLILLDAYRYNRQSLTDQSEYVTQRFRDFYKDIPPRPTEDWEFVVPEFLPDGSRNPVFVSGYGDATVTREVQDGKSVLRVKSKVPVPGWTDPQFCQYSASRKSCFQRQPHPESVPEKPLPDMMAGEDKECENRTFVTNYRNQLTTSGGFQEAEVYTTYERVQSQKDAGFKRSARDVTETISKGRPSEHTRKEKLYEKIDPTEGDANTEEFEYRISTVDYEDERIVGETASYPYARTFEEAIAGLQTDLEIINTRDTKGTSVELKHSFAVKEGELINLEGHGRWRVLAYQKTLSILAPGVLQPGRMALTLGKAIPAPPINVVKVAIPKEQPESDLTASKDASASIVNFNFGNLVPGRTRGS